MAFTLQRREIGSIHKGQIVINAKKKIKLAYGVGSSSETDQGRCVGGLTLKMRLE